MIANAELPRDAAIIDIGGGASRLLDQLLDLGYSDLTLLDISANAIGHARKRLGERARRIRSIEADVTRFKPLRTYACWHDRAAFHFLTDGGDRANYVRALRAALRPGGFAIIATFAPDGPKRCSGLDIVRYDAGALADELGSGFSLIEQDRETHRTPAGREQKFAFCRFLRLDVG
jgi:SAM-dependent methyltransferase